MRNNAVTTACTIERIGRVWSHRRSGGLVVLVAAALAPAVCGGGPSSSGVANLGKSSSNAGRHTTTTLSQGNPTQLLNQWAACMRSHGDPNQADPTVDANKDIDITWDPAIPGGYNGTNKGGQGNSG